MESFKKKILIFGGTGSLGRALAKKFLKSFEIAVFSRDEDKQFRMRKDFPEVHYIIGDIRNYDSVLKAVQDYKPHYIINASAMKQVPICEDFPWEAVMTNTMGTHNLVRAVENAKGVDNLETIVSISSDKACNPINSYGMTKALQERIHIQGKGHIFNCVRYGNILESTGSVIPFFKHRLENGLDLPVTNYNMTRFFLSFEDAINLIVAAMNDKEGKKIFIPIAHSAKVLDLAKILCKVYHRDESIIRESQIRPGEKIHEAMISEHEFVHARKGDGFYVLYGPTSETQYHEFDKEYSSKDCLLTCDEFEEFLRDKDVI